MELKLFETRMETLKSKLDFNNVELALITDEDSIYYFTGYYDYLHMDFGRPTILVVSPEKGSQLITPEMERHMANASAKVDKISFWNDGKGNEWRENLPEILNNVNTVAFETNLMPPLVQNFIKNYLIKPISKPYIPAFSPKVSDAIF